jgi:hypothetical protein
MAAPSLNVTLPLGEEPVTVAMNVTLWPNTPESMDASSAVPVFESAPETVALTLFEVLSPPRLSPATALIHA